MMAKSYSVEIKKNIAIALMLIIPLGVFSQKWLTGELIFEGNKFIGFSEYYYNFIDSQIDSVLTVGFDEKGQLHTYNAQLKITAQKYSSSGLDGRVVIEDTISKRVHVLNYKNNVLDGIACILFQNDTIAKVLFVKGKKIGVQTEIEGDLLIESVYEAGLLNGAKVIKNRHTNIILSYATFVDGKKNGLYFSNHPNGILKNFLLFKDDEVKDGAYYDFDQDGKLKTHSIFKGGKRIFYQKFDIE